MKKLTLKDETYERLLQSLLLKEIQYITALIPTIEAESDRKALKKELSACKDVLKQVNPDMYRERVKK